MLGASFSTTTNLSGVSPELQPECHALTCKVAREGLHGLSNQKWNVSERLGSGLTLINVVLDISHRLRPTRGFKSLQVKAGAGAGEKGEMIS